MLPDFILNNKLYELRTRGPMNNYLIQSEAAARDHLASLQAARDAGYEVFGDSIILPYRNVDMPWSVEQYNRFYYGSDTHTLIWELYDHNLNLISRCSATGVSCRAIDDPAIRTRYSRWASRTMLRDLSREQYFDLMKHGCRPVNFFRFHPTAIWSYIIYNEHCNA